MNRGPIGKNDVEIVDETSHVENIPKPSLVTQVGDFRVVGLTPDDADFYNNYPEDERKKVFRKVSILDLAHAYNTRLTLYPGRQAFNPHARSSVPDLPYRSCKYRQC